MKKTKQLLDIVQRYEDTDKYYISSKLGQFIKDSGRKINYYAKCMGDDISPQTMYNWTKSDPTYKIGLLYLLKFCILLDKDIEDFLKPE